MYSVLYFSAGNSHIPELGLMGTTFLFSSGKILLVTVALKLTSKTGDHGVAGAITGNCTNADGDL